MEAAPRPRAIDIERIDLQLDRLKVMYRTDTIIEAESIRESRALKAQREVTTPSRGTSPEELRRAAAQLDDLGRLWADGTPEERAQLVDMFIRHVRGA